MRTLNAHAKAIYQKHLGTHYQHGPLRNTYQYIKRPNHGLRHAIRVALFIRMLYTLLKSDQLVSNWSETALLRLQICAMLHDTGRENDGADIWDEHSAILCYRYFKENGYTEDTCIYFAEIILNKDYHLEAKQLKKVNTSDPEQIQASNDFNRIKLIDENHCYIETTTSSAPRNLKQYEAIQLLHDADCIDIIRARAIFNASYLHCWHTLDDKHYRVLLSLLFSARGFIVNQGDGYHNQKDRYIRNDFEKGGWPMIKSHTHYYPALTALLNNRLPSPRTINMNDRVLTGFYSKHGLIFRGIARPTQITNKHRISHAHFELLLQQIGLKNRSCSWIGPLGQETYTLTGLLYNTEKLTYKMISIKNKATGKGTKNHITQRALTTEEAQLKFNTVRKLLQLTAGGIHQRPLSRLHGECIPCTLSINDIIGVAMVASNSLTNTIGERYHNRNYIGYRSWAANYLPTFYLLFVAGCLAKTTFSRLEAIKCYSYNPSNQTLQRYLPQQDKIIRMWQESIKATLNSYFFTVIIDCIDFVLSINHTALFNKVCLIQSNFHYNVFNIDITTYYPIEWKQQLQKTIMTLLANLTPNQIMAQQFICQLIKAAESIEQRKNILKLIKDFLLHWPNDQLRPIYASNLIFNLVEDNELDYKSLAPLAIEKNSIAKMLLAKKVALFENRFQRQLNSNQLNHHEYSDDLQNEIYRLNQLEIAVSELTDTGLATTRGAGAGAGAYNVSNNVRCSP